MRDPCLSHPIAVWRAINAFAWRKAILAEKRARVSHESLVCRRLAPSLPNYYSTARAVPISSNKLLLLEASFHIYKPACCYIWKLVRFYTEKLFPGSSPDSAPPTNGTRSGTIQCTARGVSDVAQSFSSITSSTVLQRRVVL